jgi:hypothetical protein
MEITIIVPIKMWHLLIFVFSKELIMKNLNANVVVSYSDIIGSGTFAIPTEYPPLNKNSLDIQKNNSNEMSVSLIVRFLEKSDNKTNVIEVAENNMFRNSKIGSEDTKQPMFLV